MATFVILGRFTDQGARSVQDLRGFVEGNMARGQRLGVKIIGWYLTQGQYDIVIVAEAPDAETMLAQNAGVAGTGNVRTETLRAFSLDEAAQIVQRVTGS